MARKKQKGEELEEMPIPDDGPNDQEMEMVCFYYEHKCTKSEALQHAYPSTKTWKRASIHVTASKIFARPRVKAFLEELQKEARERAVVSAHEHMKELKDLRDEARKAGQMTAAVMAETNIGKVAGLYVEKRMDLPKVRPSLVVKRPERNEPSGD